MKKRCHKFSLKPHTADCCTRVHPRFFDQVGHETMYASSGNKHFFAKSCQTKIMSRAYKKWAQFLKIQYLKNQNYQKVFFNKVRSLSKIFFIDFFSKRFYQFLTQTNDFESKDFEILEEVVHNFGKSDDDMIQ